MDTFRVRMPGADAGPYISPLTRLPLGDDARDNNVQIFFCCKKTAMSAKKGAEPTRKSARNVSDEAPK